MNRKRLALTSLFLLTICLSGLSPALAQTAPSLGTAAPFAVLGGSAVTNTGPTVVKGNLGVSPGSAITGFPPGIVNGVQQPADTAAAQTALTSAYNDAAGQPCTQNLTGQDLASQNLGPGVYCFDSSASLSGNLNLIQSGTGVFIFRVGSTLTTASGSTVNLVNGASECNVFWQVGSSATLGTNSSFAGNILALTSITVTTGAGVLGRALARNGAVTLDSNPVTNNCAAGPGPGPGPGPGCPTITITPTTTPNAIVGVTYSQQFTGNGGAGPYTFTLTTGTLPAGLTLSAPGLLAGTPTTAGPSTFTITATDANACTGAQALTASVTTAVPTLPQMFVVLLAFGLAMAGYLRLRQRA